MAFISRAANIVAVADKTGLIIEKFCGAICVLCFATMTLVAILGVFFRYIMQSPFMWTEEVARYLLVWLGFTAISIALRQDRHIKVELIAQACAARGCQNCRLPGGRSGRLFFHCSFKTGLFADREQYYDGFHLAPVHVVDSGRRTGGSGLNIDPAFLKYHKKNIFGVCTPIRAA
jgi:hypothetical protein